MKRELGIAYCGLACCLCHENDHCVGCQKGGCGFAEHCKSYQCCTQKEYHSCADCSDFPCSDSILHKQRIAYFCEFAKEYGEEVLLDCLARNEQQGVLYHYPEDIVGDYDQIKSKEEMYQFLLHGEIAKG